MFCSKCGHELDELAVFCTFCGNAIGRGGVTFCSTCGAGINRSDRFCKCCGKTIENSDSDFEELIDELEDIKKNLRMEIKRLEVVLLRLESTSLSANLASLLESEYKKKHISKLIQFIDSVLFELYQKVNRNRNLSPAKPSCFVGNEGASEFSATQSTYSQSLPSQASRSSGTMPPPPQASRSAGPMSPPPMGNKNTVLGAGVGRPAPKQRETFISKIGGIFSGKKGKKEKEEITHDDVQFRAAAPAVLEKGAYSNVKFLMYHKDDFERANREVERIADKVKESSSGDFDIERGERIRIVLQSPDIIIEDDMQELVWDGRFSECTFEIFVPEDYMNKQIRLKGRVYCGQAVLTDIKLILDVNSANWQDITVEKCKLCSAFVSYSSEDRAKVIARIQGIQAARKDMDIFMDVEKLRCGEYWESRLFSEIEKRDLFYLFWSENAKASEWVQRELTHAIKCHGIDSVEPIPLEAPDKCPPPEELSAKHFNDWTLRYLER